MMFELCELLLLFQRIQNLRKIYQRVQYLLNTGAYTSLDIYCPEKTKNIVLLPLCHMEIRYHMVKFQLMGSRRLR